MSFQAYAPGRVELLGNHTDYNEGYVLSAAIDRGMTASGRALADGRVRLISVTPPATVEVAADAFVPQAGEEAWANYPLGVVRCLREAGQQIGAFEARFESTLPTGAGLSSSAAFEVATAKLLEKVFGFGLDPLDLAKLCRKAENEFVGVNCGLLDQVSSVFGQADHAVFLDCREESVERIPFPHGLSLLVVHSGVKHALVAGEYNERREHCFEAARRLGVRALRDATPELLEAGRDTMDDLSYRRAKHVVGENARVLEGVGHLRAGRGEAFGKLMFASHESSRENFENSIPELDVLVEAAAKQPGVMGARLTGGGFGGAIVALVRSEAAGQAAEGIVREYRDKTGLAAAPHFCRIADGAR